MKLSKIKQIVSELVDEELQRSLKENWQGEEPGDGYSNDYQRAFAHSQATTPRNNETNKAKELAKQGKFVVLVSAPVYCKSTDACLGQDISIYHVAKTYDEASEKAEEIYKRTQGDYDVQVIGSDDVKPKPATSNKEPDEDVPFQEGVGYVSDKDMKTDPKHIKGERWRIKFQSDDDLKKHGNTETSPVNETISKQTLKHIIKEIVSELWTSKNDAGGDEEHPVNEILNTYDSIISYVSSLPEEEQRKISILAKEKDLSAYDAVLEYIRNLPKKIKEVAPPGWEKTAKGMKKHKNIDNPWALAWSMKNKGMKPHKKEGTVLEPFK